MKILFLTDVHFEASHDEAYLNSAIRRIQQSGRVDYVVVGGDIINAKYGNAKGCYKVASAMIARLASSVLINESIDNVIVCPGNHDIDEVKARDTLRQIVKLPSNYKRESTVTTKLKNYIQKKKQVKIIEHIDLLRSSFNKFEEFCKALKISPYKNSFYEDNYLFGFKEFADVRFLILNSSWFCYKGHDDRQLSIGNDLVDKLIRSKEEAFLDEKLNICVFHHDISCLHVSEIYRYHQDNRIAPALSNVINKFDLLFTGHIHGLHKTPVTYHKDYGQLLNLKCGAFNDKPLDDNVPKNCFMIYEFNKFELTKRHEYTLTNLPKDGATHALWHKNSVSKRKIRFREENKDEKRLIGGAFSKDFNKKLLLWFLRENGYTNSKICKIKDLHAYRVLDDITFICLSLEELMNNPENFSDLGGGPKYFFLTWSTVSYEKNSKVILAEYLPKVILERQDFAIFEVLNFTFDQENKVDIIK